MPSDKDRLYIALYARGGASKMPGGEDKWEFPVLGIAVQLKFDRYHWSFLVGPKTEPKEAFGRRCHAKETFQIEAGVPQTTWVFEDRPISLLPTSAILVRIIIGKIADKARLMEAFAKTPIRAGTPGYEHWNCVSWIEEALSRAAHDGKALGSCHTDWKYVRDTAMWYIAKKAAEHRFDGQKEFDKTKVPTWDAIEGKELIA